MTTPSLVVVGASWGGLHALGVVLGALVPGFAAAVAVAQHRGHDTPRGALVTTLAARCSLPVVEVEDKAPMEPSTVYLAPPDYHLLVDGSAFALSVDAPVQHSRPSVDVLFQTAADARGDEVVAVVLTGANHDGADGAARVRDAGGYVIVQDPATAERAEMPGAVIERGAADEVLPLERIGPRLVALVGVS